MTEADLKRLCGIPVVLTRFKKPVTEMYLLLGPKSQGESETSYKVAPQLPHAVGVWVVSIEEKLLPSHDAPG